MHVTSHMYDCSIIVGIHTVPRGVKRELDKERGGMEWLMLKGRSNRESEWERKWVWVSKMMCSNRGREWVRAWIRKWKERNGRDVADIAGTYLSCSALMTKYLFICLRIHRICINLHSAHCNSQFPPSFTNFDCYSTNC